MTKERRKEVTKAFRVFASHEQSTARDETLDHETRLDITAVAQTLSVLSSGGKPHIVEAVKHIYFVEPNAPLRKNDIVQRITRFSVNGYVARSTVYAWLAIAREVYWAIRHYE